MSAGEVSIQEAFGQAWEVLPPDMQSAYENALLVQQARVLLAAAALYGAMNDGDVGESQIESLRGRLEGLHLSELEQLGDKIEGVASQLRLPPYAPTESDATVLSLVEPRARVAAETAVEQTLASGDEPLDSNDCAPDESVIVPGVKGSPVAEAPKEADASPESEPVEKPITKTEHRALIKVFGESESDRVNGLTRPQIDKIISKLSDIYLAGNTKRALAPRQLNFWMRHLEGATDGEISSDAGNVSAPAIYQSRHVLYKIIARANPSIDLILGIEQEAAHPEGDNTLPIAKAAEESQPSTSKEDLLEQLTSELDIIGDSLGMSGREKRELKQRLSNTDEVVVLTKEAKSALQSIDTKYHRLVSRGNLKVTNLEKAVFEKITGAEDGSMYPPSTVAGMMYEELAAAKSSATSVLVGILQKINKANRVPASDK